MHANNDQTFNTDQNKVLTYCTYRTLALSIQPTKTNKQTNKQTNKKLVSQTLHIQGIPKDRAKTQNEFNFVIFITSWYESYNETIQE